MMSWATLSVFIPTFLFVSLTPGMCMTLAMVLGMTQGVKRTLWMMVGELIGVGFVAAAAGGGRRCVDAAPARTIHRLQVGGRCLFGLFGHHDVALTGPYGYS